MEVVPKGVVLVGEPESGKPLKVSRPQEPGSKAMSSLSGRRAVSTRWLKKTSPIDSKGSSSTKVYERVSTGKIHGQGLEGYFTLRRVAFIVGVAILAWLLIWVANVAFESYAWFHDLSPVIHHMAGAVVAVLVGVAIGLPLYMRHLRLARIAAAEMAERRRREEDAAELRKEIDDKEVLQREVEENQRSLKTLLNNLPGFAYRCLHDREWTMTLASSGCFQTCGATPEELLSGKVSFGTDIILKSDQESVWREVSAAIEAKRPFELRYRIKRHDNGEIRECWERGTGVFDSEGKLEAIEGFIHDVTEREGVVRKLAEREATLRGLFESRDVNMAVLRITEHDFRIELINEEGAVFYGRPAAEVMGADLRELGLTEQVIREGHANYLRIAKSGKSETAEYGSIDSNGKNRRYRATVNPILAPDDGSVWYVSIVAIEITDRVEAEELLDGILRSSTQGVMAFHAIRDDSGKVVDLEWLLTNAEAERLVGRTNQELKGKRLLAEMPGNGLDGLFDSYVRVLETGEPFHTQHQYNHEHLSRWFAIAAAKLGDGVAVSFSDVTDRVRAEQRMTALGRLIDQSTNEVYIIDAETQRFLSVNYGAIRNSGYSMEELLDLTVQDLAVGVPDEVFSHIIHELVSGARESMTVEGQHRRKDGTTYPTEVSVHYGEYGGRKVFMSVVVDLTERVAAERRLRESQERLEIALKGAGLGVWDWNIGSETTDFDQRYAQMLGYTREELREIRKRWRDVCHPDDYNKAREALNAYLAGETEQYASEVRLRMKNGQYLWVLDRGEIVERDATGRPIRMTGTHLDIDAHKRVQVYQEEIWRLRERQQQILENSGLIEFHVGPDRRIRWMSQVVTRVLGYTPEQMIGTEFGGLEHPDYRGTAFSMFERLYTKGSGLEQAETRVMDKEGNWRWVSVVLSEIDRGKNGELLYGGIASDITLRKEAEAALRLSEERLDLAVSGAGLGTWDWDLVTGERFYNDRWLSMLGWTREDVLSRDDFFDSLLLPEDFPEAKATWEKHLRGEVDYYRAELRLRTKDGGYKWILDRGRVVERDSDGRPLRAAGTHFDIDAEKRVQVYQEELAAVRERLRQIIDNTDQIEFYTGLDLCFSYVSPVAERVMGVKPEELVGRRCLDVIHPEDKERVAQYKADVLKSGVGRRGLEYRVMHADGVYYWHTTSLSLTLSREGEPIGIGGITSDISARKQAEAESEALKSQFLQSQKMEAVGRLVGGVAHDFNNLLTPILGRAEMLLQASSKVPGIREDVETIRDAAARAGEVTRQLLAFSRKQVMQMKILDVNAVLKDFSNMLSRLIGEHITLEIELGDDLGLVKGDASQLQQVLMNLAVNARDAMVNGGQLTISTRAIAAPYDGVVDYPHVEISVADTGCGIAPEVLPYVFEPFFTTKERDKGTGLGLSTVYGIVQQHGGSIQVQSHIGEGSIFRVHIPVSEESLKEPSRRKSAVRADSSRGRVFVVEDDEMVRMLVQDALTDDGHLVHTAFSPANALSILDTLPEFDVLLTDVVMPGMRGPDLFAKIKSMRPGVRVVFMSGYTDDVVGRMGLQQEEQEPVFFLQKPFTIEDLCATVSKAIDAGAAS